MTLQAETPRGVSPPREGMKSGSVSELPFHIPNGPFSQAAFCGYRVDRSLAVYPIWRATPHD
jgi:hypothetical protein